jgi:mannose-6-phosphate isomerase-like protein (cupin superfamily)
MSRVQKPWGNYETLRLEEGFQVKRIEVSPGHRLSYQTHARRAEKWTIVRGSGLVVLNDREYPAAAGSVFEIPIGAKHRIQNTASTPLIFVEVQIGDYLGEEDIIRLEDDYRRN